MLLSKHKKALLCIALTCITCVLTFGIFNILNNQPEKFDKGNKGELNFDNTRDSLVEWTTAMATKESLWSDKDGSSKYVLGDANATPPENTTPITITNMGIKYDDIASEGVLQDDLDALIPTQYSIFQKVTWVDGDVLSKEYNIDDYANEHGTENIQDLTLGQVASFTETYGLMSKDYVMAWLSPNAQLGGDEIIQTVFTALNNDGEILEGCVYDFDTGIALIPTSVLEEHDGCIQAQIYIARSLNPENPQTQSVDISVRNATNSPDVLVGENKQDFPIFDTGMNIPIAKPGTNLPDDAIEVRLNGSISAYTQKSYDSESGCMQIAVTPDRVGRVDILVHSANNKAYADAASDMAFAKSTSGKYLRMPDDGTLQVGDQCRFITDFWMFHGVNMSQQDYNNFDKNKYEQWEQNLYVPRNNGSWTEDAYIDSEYTGYAFTTSSYAPKLINIIMDIYDYPNPHFERVTIDTTATTLAQGGENDAAYVIMKASQISKGNDPSSLWVPVAFAGRCYYPQGYVSGTALDKKVSIPIPGKGYEEPLPADYNPSENYYRWVDLGDGQGRQLVRYLTATKNAVQNYEGLESDGERTNFSEALKGMSENILEDHNGDLNALNLCLLCSHTQRPLWTADYYPYVTSNKYGQLAARVLAINRDAAEPYAVIGFVSSSIGFGLSSPNATQGLQCGSGLYKVKLEPTVGQVTVEKQVEGPDADPSMLFTFHVNIAGAVNENIQLSANSEPKLYENLNPDSNITVTEENVDSHYVSELSWPDGHTVKSGETVRVIGKNRRKTGSLTVEKVVIGVSQTREFSFRVKITRPNGTEFLNQQFTLHSGQTRTFSQIPTGYSYEVTEESVPGFKTEWENRTGSIPENDGANVRVKCTNKELGYATMEKRLDM